MVNKITTPPTTLELIGKVNELVDDKQDIISDLSTIRSGADLGATALQPNDNISELNNNVGYITGITSSDVTTALGYTPYNSSNPSNYQTATQVANSIATETTNRESADNNLQSQIDAIVSSSDVFDIVGTYAELQAYDITTVPVNDIIKVLVDSTHSGAATYYRCVETGGVKSWSYIGSEGAYYTKGEADAAFVPQTRTINNKALSANITLTASDVGALPSSTVIPTVNNPTITITQGGVSKGSFTLNQATGDTIALDAGGGSSYTAGTGIDITNDVISVEGVKNQQNTSTAIKTWTGTLAQYNAIVTKDSNTLYNITDDDTAVAYQAYNKTETYNKTEIDTLLQDFLYYKAGDTYTQVTGDYESALSSWSGYITTNSTDLRFTMILPKSGKNITTATISVLNVVARGISGYVNSSSSLDLTSLGTVTGYMFDNRLYVRCEASSAFTNIINNTPISVAIRGITVTFS